MSSEREDAGPGPGASSEPGDPIAIARVAASTWWNTTQWMAGTSARAAGRLARAALSPQEAGALLGDLRAAAGAVTGAAAGAEAKPPAEAGTPGTGEAATARARNTRAAAGGGEDPGDDGLRGRGEELLRLSRDVRYEEDAHPAYVHILRDLAPDEGRILRLLLLEGPQPAVDVRTGGPLGLINSELIAPGLSMIGPRAGCRWVERVPAYLNNLNRLGLIWFSRETLRDPHRYQVIEAQPDVLAATKSVRLPKIVRRSIHLTPFGEDFCRSCFAPAAAAAEDLPEHDAPE